MCLMLRAYFSGPGIGGASFVQADAPIQETLSGVEILKLLTRGEDQGVRFQDLVVQDVAHVIARGVSRG